MAGFKKFLLRGNVVDLAVAVVLGTAFTNVVNAFVKGFITPLIGVIGGMPDFSALSVTVNNSRFPVGEFVNALVAFLIIFGGRLFRHRSSDDGGNRAHANPKRPKNA